MNGNININEELKTYNHVFNYCVEFADADSVGIVHNLRFFYFVEYARTNYLRAVGFQVDHNTFAKTLPIMTVSNQMDYFKPARFGDELQILTKISQIKNSSLKFDNIVLLKNRTLSARATSVLVYLDLPTQRPARIPDFIRELIFKYEGSNVVFNDD